MLPFSPSQLPEELRDQRVLSAMERVPRIAFLPEDVRAEAEQDIALSIGYGQTISQPFVVAYMTAALSLKPGARVLEIGTGSGYQTAVLAEMGMNVYSVELIAELSHRAATVLDRLGLTPRVRLKIGDGRHGWAAYAPYDGIVVAAAPEHIPPAFIEQLRPGGRLVIPVGPQASQELRVLERREKSVHLLKTLPVRFVPLVKPEALA
jgi:protein-L-isoaspartate(D-aspartate) O-methyltransferase